LILCTTNVYAALAGDQAQLFMTLRIERLAAEARRRRDSHRASRWFFFALLATWRVGVKHSCFPQSQLTASPALRLGGLWKSASGVNVTPASRRRRFDLNQGLLCRQNVA
jgi:hypothetical protein